MLLKSKTGKAGMLAALICCLLSYACAPVSSTRSEEMESSALQRLPGLNPIAIKVTVYGENVGGFASHYYPLPREDFESALLKSMLDSGRLSVKSDSGEAVYDISVGLIQLIQPQWSGTVTLETSWAVYDHRTNEEVSRHAIRVQEPASFSRKREATELAAKTTITEGIKWIFQVMTENTQHSD